MAEGDILIDSELLLLAQPELGVGERTRRITTLHASDETTTREQVSDRASAAAATNVLARIEYDTRRPGATRST